MAEGFMAPVVFIAVAVQVVLDLVRDAGRVGTLAAGPRKDDQRRVVIKVQGLFLLLREVQFFIPDRAVRRIEAFQHRVDVEAFRPEHVQQLVPARARQVPLGAAEDADLLIPEERQRAVVLQQDVAFRGKQRVQLIRGCLCILRRRVIRVVDAVPVQQEGRCADRAGYKHRQAHGERKDNACCLLQCL